jgi:hypothetical protein
LLDSAEGVPRTYDTAERFELPADRAPIIQVLHRAGEPLYPQTVGKRRVWAVMPTRPRGGRRSR